MRPVNHTAVHGVNIVHIVHIVQLGSAEAFDHNGSHVTAMLGVTHPTVSCALQASTLGF